MSIGGTRNQARNRQNRNFRSSSHVKGLAGSGHWRRLLLPAPVVRPLSTVSLVWGEGVIKSVGIAFPEVVVEISPKSQIVCKDQ